MTALDQLVQIITTAKVAPDKLSEEWVYQRAWNDALDFALRQAAIIIKGENHGSEHRA